MNVSPLPAGSAPTAAHGIAPSATTDFSEALKKQPRSTKDEHDTPTIRDVSFEEARTAPPIDDVPQLHLAIDAVTEALMPENISAFVAADLGTTEQVLSARIFGLHLQASGYLSEYAAAAAATHESPLIDASSESREAVSAPEAPELSDTSAIAQAFDQASSINAAGLPLSPVTHEASAESVDAAERLSGDGLWSEWRWQGRSVRLLQSKNNEAVLWLRDYSLTESDARSLALDLLQRMRAQGIQPQRVMWNGHPIWSSNNSGQGI